MEPLSLPAVQPSVDSEGGIRGGTGVVVSLADGLVRKVATLKGRSALESTKVLCELIVGFQVPLDSQSLVPVLSANILTEKIGLFRFPGHVNVHMTMPRCGFDAVQMLNHSRKFELGHDAAGGMLWGVCDSLCALRDILGPDFSHGDIKLDNIMTRPVGGGFRSCLIDYGHCKSSKFRGGRTRLKYWAPLERYECGVQSDMWSVGILAVCLTSSTLRTYLQGSGLHFHRAVAVVSELTGVPAPQYSHLTQRQIRVARGGARLREVDRRLLAPSCRDAREKMKRRPGLWQVVSSCLSWDPARRPDPRDVCETLWRYRYMPINTIDTRLVALLDRASSGDSSPDAAEEGEYSTMATRRTRRTVKKIRNLVLNTSCEEQRKDVLMGWVKQVVAIGRDTLSGCLDK